MPPSPHAEELRVLLKQTNEIVARRAKDWIAYQSELNELEVDLAFAEFAVHGDATKLETELQRLFKAIAKEMEKYSRLGRIIETTIREKMKMLPAAAMKSGDGIDASKTWRSVKQKTVLQFDMAGYSTVSSRLEESFGVDAVEQLNRQIADFGEEALRSIEILRRQVFLGGGGDGATLAFDQPSQAFDFSEHFFWIVQSQNRRIKEDGLIPLFRRYFRIGGSTGDISWTSRGGGDHDAAGTHINHAVRFQDAGRPGELFVDESTFTGLTAQQQSRFEEVPVEVKGKRDEVFNVRRCIFDADAATEAQRHGLWQPKL